MVIDNDDRGEYHEIHGWGLECYATVSLSSSPQTGETTFFVLFLHEKPTNMSEKDTRNAIPH
jgi:hypothetical protein